MLTLLVFILILTACTACTAPQNDNHYSAEFPYEPLQYMTFLKKEIQSIENQLNSAMSLAVMGDYTADQAADTAKNSLSIIESAKDSIKVMRPPTEYADTRVYALDTIAQIENDMDKFIEELENPDKSSERLIEIKNKLQGDSVSLASLVNAYWE
jgi:hypothetical protein